MGILTELNPQGNLSYLATFPLLMGWPDKRGLVVWLLGTEVWLYDYWEQRFGCMTTGNRCLVMTTGSRGLVVWLLGTQVWLYDYWEQRFGYMTNGNRGLVIWLLGAEVWLYDYWEQRFGCGAISSRDEYVVCLLTFLMLEAHLASSLNCGRRENNNCTMSISVCSADLRNNSETGQNKTNYLNILTF